MSRLVARALFCGRFLHDGRAVSKLCASNRVVLISRVFCSKPTQDSRRIWTIPNALTFGRLLLTPVIGYSVIQESYETALVLASVAGVSDVLDGYIARRLPGQQSALGAIIDPVADKVLVGVLSVCLSWNGLLPVALTALFLLRDTALMSGLLVLRYKNLRPISLARLFDFSGQDTKVAATKVSKANTALQLSLIVASMGAPVWDYVGSAPLQALWLATTVTTFWSGAQYWQQRHTLHAVRRPATKGGASKDPGDS